MKKTFVIKAIAAIFATAMMSFTKKAYRWNADNRSWQPAYLLNYLPGDGIYLIDYAEYDKASGAFTQNIQTSIYYQQAENGMLLTDIQR